VPSWHIRWAVDGRGSAPAPASHPVYPQPSLPERTLSDGLIQSWWVLLAVPLLVRVLTPGSRRPDRGLDRRDALLAALCGVVLALLCGFWLADFHLLDGPLSSSDFHEYCGGVVALREGVPGDFTRQRSMLAAAPSVWLAGRVGVLDGMAGAALLSMAGIGVGLYGWGRALGSRLAGVAAVLAGATVAPLVNLSRTLSFYPETTAAFTLGTAAAVAAARWRTLPLLALCGAGAGLCFLADLRGLLWGLAVVAVGGLAAVSAPARRWPLRLAVLLLPVWVAWQAGPLAYGPDASPLEGQTDVLQRIRDRGGTPTWDRSELPRTAYVWGRSDPLEIPATLHALAEQARRIPDWMRDHPRSVARREAQLDPVLPLLGGAGLLTALGLASQRRWRVLLAAGATAVPFVASVRSAVVLGQLHPRYLATSGVLLAALLGASMALLAGRGRWRLLAGSVVALVVALGVLPSPLSPIAAWRVPGKAQRADIAAFLVEVDTGETHHPHGEDCGRGLRQDRDRGLEPGGRLHGGVTVSAEERQLLQRRAEGRQRSSAHP